MDIALAKTGTEDSIWGGGQRPMGTKYGKMMMWYFLTSDSLTFASFVLGYGVARYKFLDIWPIADDVFNEVPFMHGVEAPLIYTAFMTFLLIFSSVTMVLAVHYGHELNRKKVTLFMALTIFGGLTFIGSQAFEWAGFIKGQHGAIEMAGGKIVHLYNTDGHRVSLQNVAVAGNSEREALARNKALWFKAEKSYLPAVSYDEVKAGILANDNVLIRLPNFVEQKNIANDIFPPGVQKADIANPEAYGSKMMLTREGTLNYLNNNKVKGVVEGANLTHNEYGHPLFADFFFFITGFHGFHVTIGIILLIITFFNVLVGTYERRGHYTMVEKVGLYWHFVDLVWVFVFTFFYLV